MNPTTSIKSRMVNVTPAMAEKWLTYNTHNRKMSEKLVDSYAGAMARGEWRENGDAIRFSKEPRVLLDGQQRLAAVAQSGCTVRMLVVEGLDHETQSTMDAGRKRSFADVLRLRGETDPLQMAALCNRVYRWRAGELRNRKSIATHAQLLEIYERERDSLDESLRIAHSVRRMIPVSASMLAAAHFFFSEIDAGDADFFYARLRDGENLSQGDPILAIRRLLLNSTIERRWGRFSDTVQLALLVKAWNAFRTGTQVRTLSWRAGGATPEEFPLPV